MTPPPTDPGDQMSHDLPEDPSLALASAVADGFVVPEQEGQSTASPQVIAVAEQFRALRDHLRQPLQTDAAHLESHLVAALAAFDALPRDERPASDPAVVSLDAARRRRTRRLAPAFAAAAAAAVIGLVIGAVANRDSSHSDLSLSSKSTTADTAAANDRPPVPEIADAATPADAAGAGESDANVARAGVIAAASVDTVPTNSADAVVDNIDNPVIVIESPAQLSPVAQSVLAAHRADGHPLPSTHCTELAGVVIADIVWNQHDAFLAVAPNLDTPTHVLVVSPVSCGTEVTVALKG